jgi:hypothetical protein
MVLNNSSPGSNKDTAHHFNQLSLHKDQTNLFNSNPKKFLTNITLEELDKETIRGLKN